MKTHFFIACAHIFRYLECLSTHRLWIMMFLICELPIRKHWIQRDIQIWLPFLCLINIYHHLSEYLYPRLFLHAEIFKDPFCCREIFGPDHVCSVTYSTSVTVAKLMHGSKRDRDEVVSRVEYKPSMAPLGHGILLTPESQFPPQWLL